MSLYFQGGDRSSIVVITPLYGFHSDINKLVIAEDIIEIRRFESFPLIPGDERFVSHLRVKRTGLSCLANASQLRGVGS